MSDRCVLAQRAAEFAMVLVRVEDARGLVGVRGCGGHYGSYGSFGAAKAAAAIVARALAPLGEHLASWAGCADGSYIITICGVPLPGPEPYADAEARRARIVERLAQALEVQHQRGVDDVVSDAHEASVRGDVAASREAEEVRSGVEVALANSSRSLRDSIQEVLDRVRLHSVAARCAEALVGIRGGSVVVADTVSPNIVTQADAVSFHRLLARRLAGMMPRLADVADGLVVVEPRGDGWSLSVAGVELPGPEGGRGGERQARPPPGCPRRRHRARLARRARGT